MNNNNIRYLSIASVFASAIGVITAPLTAWVFPQDDVGRLAIYQITSTFLILTATFGLDQVFIREFYSSENKGQLLKICSQSGIYTLLTICGILLFQHEEASTSIYKTSQPYIILLAIIGYISNHFLRFSTLAIRMQGLGKEFFITTIAPKILQASALISLYLTTNSRNYTELLLISVSSIAIASMIGLWHTRNLWIETWQAKIDKDKLFRFYKFGIPLSFSNLALWALTSIPIIMLSRLSSLRELATYTIAVSFAGVASAFQTAFATIYTPYIFKHLHEGGDSRRVHELLRICLALSLIITATYGIFGWAVSYFIPANYSGVKEIIICCAIPPLLTSLTDTSSIGISISRKTYLSLLVTIIALIFNISAAFFLIPKYGAIGAATSNALSFLVYFIGKTEASCRVWKSFRRKSIYFISTSLTFFSIINSLFATKYETFFPLIWLTGSIPYVWYFKAEIQSIKNKVLK